MDMRRSLNHKRNAALAAVLMLTAVVLLPAALSVTAGDDSEGPWWFPTQGEWVETQALRLPDFEDPSNHMDFGAQVAIDGDTLVASTQSSMSSDFWFRCPGLDRPLDHPEFEDGCDWVFVYNRAPDGEWVQTAKLVPNDAEPGDSFGAAVAVDEDAGVIVVGNPGVRTHGDEFVPPAALEQINKVHVFERQLNGTWEEAATIQRDYPEPDVPYENWQAAFGIAVAVSDHTIAVADGYYISFENFTFDLDPHTYVFEKVNGSWVETVVLEGGGSSHGVDLAGDTLVTARGQFVQYDCGRWGDRSMLVYDRDANGEWALSASFQPEVGYEKPHTSITQFALSEDGTTVVLGSGWNRRVYGVHTEHCVTADAPSPVGRVEVDTRLGVGAHGSAWVYELIDGAWVQTADIPNPMPDPNSPMFGNAVDVSGGTVVIGADTDNYNGEEAAGAAYVYEKGEGEWELQAKLRNHDSDRVDFFGDSVGVSGDTVVVGAPWNTKLGAVHVFEPLGPAAVLPVEV